MTPLLTLAESGTVVAVALAAGVLLLGLMVRLELRRAPGKRRRRRLAASAVCIAGLWGLVLSPALRRVGDAGEAVLMTPGAPLRTPGSLEGRVFALADTPEAQLLRATVIPDLAHLARSHPEVERLRVVGHGLRSWDWESYSGTVEPAAATPLPPGIREITWARSLALGEQLAVRGVLSGTGGVLRLRGPGGIEDERDVKMGPFELRASPREPGRFLYSVELHGPSGRQQLSEALPVEVVEPRRVAVLWLEAAPTFESRHLKAWLADRGDPVAVRAAISRDRFRHEVRNMPDLDLSRLTASLLRRFDLVIVDGASLDALSTTEAGALHGAVGEGLGVLLLPGAGSSGAGPLFGPLRARQVADLEEWTVQASWPDVPRAAPLVVPAREVIPAAGVMPLVQDAGDRLLAACRVDRRGRVAISLLGGTYRWILEGSPALHAALWSHLIGELARPADAARWRLPGGPILIDRPLSIVLESSEPLPEALVAAEGDELLPLPLRQDPLEPTRWTATWWPRTPGWHRLATGEGGEGWFHAQSAESWATWQAARRMEATAARAVLGPAGSLSDATRAATPRRLPRMWFYLLFLAGAFTLWADERWGAPAER